MRGHLFDNLGEVASLLREGPIGLLLDLDGTISEIVPQPDEASVSPSIKAVLRELSRSLPLVSIITGRSAGQARDIVGVEDLVYVGNHGLEWIIDGRETLAEEASPYLPSMRRLLVLLREKLPLEGLFFEDKGGSFAIHYRHAPDPGVARESILKAIEELAQGEVRTLMGKAVVDVLCADVSLVKEFPLFGAILIGDDVTELDSFRAAGKLSSEGGFAFKSIAVVSADSPPELKSEAELTLLSVAEVERFLVWLADKTDLDSGFHRND
ncbi:MAG: trehalose-phosphatase [Dehalococcoidia bacterium]|nr:trehalose-phosphatase [Dehalococcoidia bacterium]